MKQFLQRKKQLLSILLVCYVAIVAYRVAFVWSHFYFSQDEARDLLLMEQQIEQGRWVVAYGPKASVGDFYLPPFYYQVHLLVTRVFGNQPWAMHMLTALVESATPIVFFAVLSLFFSKRSAMVGALLYAISYQPLTFAVNAWNPNMIPFFSMLALYGWLRVLIKKQYSWIPISVVSVTIAVHLHYQAVVVLPFALLAAVVVLHQDTARRSLRWWALGVLGAVLLTAPYLIAEAQNHWQNTRQIVSYFTQDHAHYYDRVGKVAFVTKFIPAFVERSIAHEAVGDGVLGLVLLAAGALALLLQIRMHPTKQLHWLILYYVLILVMLRVYKGDKLDYYMSTLLTLPALCAVALLERWPVLGSAVTLVLAVIAIRSVWTLPPVNQLTELNAAMQRVAQAVPEPSVRVVVQDDDFANTLVYGIHSFSPLRIDQSSTAVVEVYKAGRQPSEPIFYDSCSDTESSEYFEQLHATGGYQTIARITTNDYHLDVARLQCQPSTTVPHPLAAKNTFGSDFVVPELFK